MEKFVIDRESLRQPWMTETDFTRRTQEVEARMRTKARQEQGGNKAIILTKAQHPLSPDGAPGPEYSLRLEKTLEVAKRLWKYGMEVRFITVGAIHAGNAEVTLAQAGKNWLVAHGVGEDCITMYDQAKAGNDEDAFAVEMVRSIEDATELHVVCSAGQYTRCLLSCLINGWQPQMHPITYLDADPAQSIINDLRWPGGVPAFFKEEADAVQKATEETRARHEAEMTTPT